MKSLVQCMCFVLLLAACTTKEDVGQCVGVIDFIGAPSFQLKFVDSNDNNLIENEYYPHDLISASINGQSYDNQIVHLENEPFQNVVLLPSFGNEGENRWILKLSEREIDTLDFSLVFNEVKQDLNGEFLCGTNTAVETAMFKGDTINLETSFDEESYSYSIIAIKTPE